MIVPGQAIKIVIATQPVDFRKGHDGLAAVAERELGLDPHSKHNAEAGSDVSASLIRTCGE